MDDKNPDSQAKTFEHGDDERAAFDKWVEDHYACGGHLVVYSGRYEFRVFRVGCTCNDI